MENNELNEEKKDDELKPEEVKEEKKEEGKEPKRKHRNFHVVWVTILIVLLLGVFTAIGYAVGGTSIIKCLSGDDVKETKSEKSEKIENNAVELDIDSRIVQFLYNEVTYDSDVDCFSLWQFTGEEDKQRPYMFEKYDVPEATNEVKMKVVAMNLDNTHANYVPVEDVPGYAGNLVPVTINSSSVFIEKGKYFTKSYVEALYKQIYGKDASLDTSIQMYGNHVGSIVYIYDNATKRYYEYTRATGGTCGGRIGLKLLLKKAVQDGNNIKIYQYVENIEEDVIKEKFYYVYNFEQEADGLYKFTGFVKEAIK